MLLLEITYAKSGSRKKETIERVYLSELGWGPACSKAYDGLRETLRDFVKLSYREISKSTDASDSDWAAVVTQCSPDKLDLPTMDQKHEPLAFLSSDFKGNQCNWSTYEKEGFAIYQVFRKMDYLLMVEGNIQVHTDHTNFIFVFNPQSIDRSLGRYDVKKVRRWAMYLSMYQYSITHISGVESFMSDIMTRWFSGYRLKKIAARRVSELLTQIDDLPVPGQSQFKIASLLQLLSVQ